MNPTEWPKARGARSNPKPRFDRLDRDSFDDGWASDEDPPAAPGTTIHIDKAKSIITRNTSPDVPFDRSINPYRGCPRLTEDQIGPVGRHSHTGLVSNQDGVGTMFAVIGGIKGGAGKTIVAPNLAVLRAFSGREVLLVDGDDQESATLWSATRNEVLGEKNRITAIQLTGRGTRDELQRLGTKYDDTIIDVGGCDTTTQRAALTVADILLLPFPPRGPDIWTADKVAQMIKEVRGVNHGLRAFAFLNRADRVGSDNSAATELLRQTEGIDLLIVHLGDRKAFPNAFTNGLGVSELKRPNPKAVSEIEGLYQALFETVPV